MRRALISCLIFAGGALSAAVVQHLETAPPAPPVERPAPVFLQAQCPPVWARPDESTLRRLEDQLAVLDRRVAELAARNDRERAAPPTAPVTPAQPVLQSLPPPPSVAAVLPPPPPPAWPAASEATAKMKSDLDALAQASAEQAARREAERVAVDQLNDASSRLALGDTAGISPVLASAAESLGGTAAEQLRAASRSLENEDLVTAREYIALALLNAR